MEETEEDAYLCKLYGNDCRFVKFYNNTGRPVRLTSHLHMLNYANMRWSANATIQPNCSHLWRFLGDAPNLSLYFLSLLPDPYKLALANSYSWTVSYIDTKQDPDILINSQEGRLQLQSLKELKPQEVVSVVIERKKKEPPTLSELSLDQLSLHMDLSSNHVDNLEIPRSLKEKLLQVQRDYDEMTKQAMQPCDRCQEIHH